ncbi:MAG: response regulator transcription factor [Sphingomonadales bacterium]|jgi:two-component system response regulator FixJ|nr:response regulator transcription factor [Sphingomonadales bacterium]MBK6720858.1 response regulator transcription factor [Sphingomonadales bacterium]MBK8274043.1 response regulator transcription factor [Sphingomonadales bacterium]MBK8862144.1 response regulator transcription factor [Sphingomonadales bacterium]MBK9588668.1 response regulator transcription factor [Sphingomonadales bacterium]
MTDRRQIYLVDDDDAVRRSAGFMLKTSGFAVEPFASGVEFLKEVEALAPGCILLDVRMPGMDGLEVQRALGERGITFPVIVLTGHGDVNVAVAAMKAGALDFIEKPFEKAVLLAALEEGFAQIERSDRGKARAAEAVLRLNVLTAREHDVLEGLVRGFPNKTIAYDLGISARTVEIHRANLMTKLNVRSLSEALRIAFAAGLGDTPG